MRRAVAGARIWQGWRVLRRWLGRGVLGILVGCRSPALPYSAEPDALVPPRGVVMARQVVADSAIELANRPLAGCWECITETSDQLAAWFEGGFHRNLILPLWGEPIPVTPSAQTLDAAELERTLNDVTGRALAPAHLHLHLDGREAYRALHNLITQATSRIDIVMFNWDDDGLGQALAALISAHAGPNLPVRILVDGGGNLFFSEPEDASAASVNRLLIALGQHPHVEVVRIRNPFGRFDHRKLVLVDGRWAWSGGRNFSRSSFFEFHDLSFVLDGPLVAQLQERFEQDWRLQTGASTPTAGAQASSATRTHGQTSPSPSNALARVLYSDPGNRQLAQALYHAVDQARQHIYLENVYFSDSRLLTKLLQARRRGVDVRVVLTFNSASALHDRANRVLANRLLQAGVRVYVYPGMTHVKAVSVDGVWAYLGTANFDALSLRRNYDVGLSIQGGPILAELEERLFHGDFRPEWEMTQPVPVSIQDHLADFVASLWL